MNKLTKRQEEEKECLEWFGADVARRAGEPTMEAYLEFLDWSERGVPLKKGKNNLVNNFYYWAKIWRGRQIHELWEKDFYSGFWLGWFYLLREEPQKVNKIKLWFWRIFQVTERGRKRYNELEFGRPIPRHIADFISKEIFAGKDRDRIMNIYSNL